MRQHASSPVVATAVKINFYTDLDMIKKITFAIGVLVLAGCTATPEKVTTTKPVNPPTGTNTQKKKVTPPASGVKVIPYDQKEIKRQTVTPQVVVPEQKV